MHKGIQNKTVMILLFRLSGVFFSSLMFIFPFILLVSLANNVNYFKGIKLLFASFKTLFAKTFLLAFLIDYGFSLLDFYFLGVIGGIERISVMYIIEFIETTLLTALPAYYVLSVASGWNKNAMAEEIRKKQLLSMVTLK
ncbi:MAG: hypothetical protein LBG46_06295 [Elusimicrobiota bacterium]|nr:hypothetical protein [Elusimicrobiota bacterium]